MLGAEMIGIGCATSSERNFKAGASRAIEHIAEPDSILLRRHGAGPPGDAWNEMLDEFADQPDLEAVVLLHEDVAISGEFLATARDLLAAGPKVAVLGAAGVRKASSGAWWEGERFGAINWPLIVPGGVRRQYSRGAHEVEFVDGMAVVLSGWVARTLRFDGALAPLVDVQVADMCLQARAGGRRVVVSSAFEVTSYRTYVGSMRHPEWVGAAVALGRKWGNLAR